MEGRQREAPEATASTTTPNAASLRDPLLLGVAGFLSLGLLAVVVLYDVHATPAGEYLFTEHSAVEINQVVTLILCAILTAASWRGDIEHGFAARWLLTFVFTSFAIRECDYWLDRYAFDGAWQVLVTLAALAFGAIAWPGRADFRRQLVGTLAGRTGGFLIAGFFALVFSRLFGMGDLWILILGEDHTRSAKNAAEEITESLAFLLLLLGAFDRFLGSRSQRTS